MDNIGSPYGSESPNASGAIVNSEMSNDAMMYYANASIRTLRDAKGVKVEADL